MEYLKKSFTIAVSSPKPKSKFVRDHRDNKDLGRHEYVNGSSMCLVCGLGPKAKIHEL